jgi:N-acetylglutamate synthase-like GNAT family acetyltransferase
MIDRPIRIRRGRRTDVAAVMELLAAAGIPVPPPDRAMLRRFRNLVADLGADFYLATIDERIAGVAHVTYARQLTTAPLATVATLVVADWARRRGVGTALLRFAAERAQRRTCTALRCLLVADGNTSVREFLRRAGARPAGAVLELPLSWA